MTTFMRKPSIQAALPWLLAVLLSVALAACAQGAGTSTTANPVEAGRQYAQCMRDNGVSDFPDPDADGRFSGIGHEQQDTPTYKAAAEKCRALAPGGDHQNTADPAYIEQMRQFSQCMRDHGLPDFPDPDADGRLRGAGHEQQDTPTYKAAMEACRDKLPGGGGH
jgi:hypothetical protein